MRGTDSTIRRTPSSRPARRRFRQSQRSRKPGIAGHQTTPHPPATRTCGVPRTLPPPRFPPRFPECPSRSAQDRRGIFLQPLQWLCFGCWFVSTFGKSARSLFALDPRLVALKALEPLDAPALRLEGERGDGRPAFRTLPVAGEALRLARLLLFAPALGRRLAGGGLPRACQPVA